MGSRKREMKTLNILEENAKQSQFNFEEAFRHIRANIEFSNVDHPVKSIVVTSTQANEAKTTVSINLSYIFAAKYKKVLIIDGDLRKHQLNQYMGISNKKGLTDLLFDFGKNNKKLNFDYIQQIDNSYFQGKLSVLTAGTTVPNPSEVLSSNLFKMMIKELENYYDFIIVDCPPVGMVTDAIPIGNIVDGAIFVVSAKDTSRKDAANCVMVLQRNNVNIIGSILTKAEVRKGNYYYYSYY